MPENERLKSNLLSTVAILRYNIRKSRRKAFLDLLPTYRTQLTLCKQHNVDLGPLDVSDIERYKSA